MTASTARGALSALAARHGLSQQTLTLIKDATLPNLTVGQRLNDTQIGFVHQAVEVCLLSGLTEQQIPQVVKQHRDRAPQDWQQSFWRERLALANERDTHPPAATAAQPPAADPPPAAGHPPIEPEPPRPRAAQPTPVSAIPPQPPSEVRSRVRDPHNPLAA